MNRVKINNCWNWSKSLNTYGYAQVRIAKKQKIVGRVLYEALIRKIPTGFTMDHLCRNRKCVNPYHLEAVVPAINVQRGLSAKINSKKATKIRRLYSRENITQMELAKMFGIGQGEISRIINYRIWL